MQVRKAWLATKKGISLTRKCFAAAAIGGFCYEVFPNTILLPFKRNRQDEVMQYRLGLADLPYQVQEYVRRAIDDMKFNEDQRKALSVYLTDLNDVATYGNINSQFGTLVRLPYLLWDHYNLPDKIIGEEGKFPEAREKFYKSLQWSDKAKLYITTYQIAWTQHYQFLSQGAFNAVGIMCGYIACYLMTSGKNRITDSPRAAFLINSALLTMFLASWVLATDKTNCDNEEEIIREVCKLGPDYAEGAFELYKKMQQHNLAIREMVGFAGKLRFTEGGDTRAPIRRVTVPLSERLAIVETFLENKTQNENQIVDDQKEGKIQPSGDKTEKDK